MKETAKKNEQKISREYLIYLTKSYFSVREAVANEPKERGLKRTTLQDACKRENIFFDAQLEESANPDYEAIKLRLRMSDSELRGLKKKLAHQQIIADVIEEASPEWNFRVPDVYSYKETDDEVDEEVIVVMISDCHIGMLVNPEEVGGLESYDLNVFYRRLKMFKDAIHRFINIISEHAHVRRVVLCYLGDIVEGLGIYPGQDTRVDCDPGEAVWIAAEVFSELEIEILDHLWKFNPHYRFHCTNEACGACFANKNVKKEEKPPVCPNCGAPTERHNPELFVFGVPGNHGRPGGRHKGASYKDSSNWDNIFYRIKRRELRQYEEQGLIKYGFDWEAYEHGWYMGFEIWDWLFVMFHGDGIPSHYSIPFYGLNRAAYQYTSLLQENIDGFLSAHIHQSASLPIGAHKEIKTNGAWPAANELTKKIRNATTPSQWLFSVHKVKFISMQVRLWLADPSKHVPFPRVSVTGGS